jgi:hypothetical protein
MIAATANLSEYVSNAPLRNVASKPLFGCKDALCFESFAVAILLITLGVAAMHVATTLRRANGLNICVSSVLMFANVYAGNKFGLPMCFVWAVVAAVCALLSIVEQMLCGPKPIAHTKPKTQ